MFFPDSLSCTELKVLKLIYENAKARKPHTATVLADALGVSKNTIRSHTKSIFFKLDVQSTLSAVLVSIELGILAADDC
jgi:DNA-binding CsgD family transcriptional regulator